MLFAKHQQSSTPSDGCLLQVGKIKHDKHNSQAADTQQDLPFVFSCTFFEEFPFIRRKGLPPISYAPVRYKQC